MCTAEYDEYPNVKYPKFIYPQCTRKAVKYSRIKIFSFSSFCSTLQIRYLPLNITQIVGIYVLTVLDNSFKWDKLEYYIKWK